MTPASGDLDGKVVLVTGGSRGIGRALVLGALARGASVAFCARSPGADMEAVRVDGERLAGHSRVLGMAADVASEVNVDAFFDAVLDRFGHVDVAINNASINRDALLVQAPVSAFDEVIATNLTGAFLVAVRAIREFLAQGGGGRIVSISSIADKGGPSQTAYAASKGGLRGLTRTIAKEYGRRGVYANLVVVGLVETRLSAHMPETFRRVLLDNPQRRAGTPDEVAATALFLASSRASFVNGETLYASGGLVEANIAG
jgi:3-oxoacyl-[acyl-carrier protein] reductase